MRREEKKEKDGRSREEGKRREKISRHQSKKRWKKRDKRMNGSEGSKWE